MARVLFTAVVSEIRGKIAGTTFQNSQGGFQMRTKTTSRNPRSRLQATARANWEYITRYWRSMFQEDRNEWIAYAGPSVNPFNLFCSQNSWALPQRGNIITNPIDDMGPINLTIATPIFINDGTSDYDIFEVSYVADEDPEEYYLALQFKPWFPLSQSAAPKQWVTINEDIYTISPSLSVIQFRFYDYLQTIGAEAIYTPPGPDYKSLFRIVCIVSGSGKTYTSNQVEYVSI